MQKFTSPLNNLKIASPCEENWEAMLGNEQKRYCGRCKLNVYNLSGMSKVEAERLIMNAEGRLCVRFYQRADGSVLTGNCPVGLAKLKNRVKMLATAAFTLVLSLFSGVLFVSFFNKQTRAIENLPNIFSERGTTMGAMANMEQKNTNKDYPMMGNVSVSVPKPEKIEMMGKMAAPIKPETKRKVLANQN